MTATRLLSDWAPWLAGIPGDTAVYVLEGGEPGATFFVAGGTHGNELAGIVAAAVLGVPLLLALLGRDEVVTTAALSLLAGLGDLMLPAALAGTLVARVAGVDDRMRVLRRCLWPAVLAAGIAAGVLWFSPSIGRWLR